MLYYLFDYLQSAYDFPGAGLFQYISFRAALAVITSLLVSLVFGGKIIRYIQRKQIGEEVRTLGLAGEESKKGTPTMGGLIILAAILIPTILFARLENVYVITMLIATVWLGLIGFLDDYIKVFKKNKEGLKGRFKIIGQIGVGLIVGSVLYFSDDVVVHKRVSDDYQLKENEKLVSHEQTGLSSGENYKWVETDEMTTTIPFVKDNEFNYKWLFGGDGSYGWLIFIPIVIFIVIAVSNGANMTDGLDGLATGTSAIVGIALAILAYVSSHASFAEYLNVMYIPYAEELVIFISAFVGACIGFLWFNSYPAQVFMGDTGSLAIGGLVGIIALMIHQPLTLIIVGGIFVIEAMSVILQVASFKLRGKRIFLMSPIHHHFELKGWKETKVVIRFWILSLLFALLGLATLKLR